MLPSPFGVPGGTNISYMSFLHECRAVFLAYDRELVSDGKVLS